MGENKQQIINRLVNNNFKLQSEKAELVEMLKLLVDRLEENGLGELNAVNRAKQLLTKING